MNSEELISYVQAMPEQTLIGIGAVVFAAILALGWAIVSKRHFQTLIRRSVSDETAASTVMERFYKKPKAKTARLLLEHIPDSALFSVFLAAIDNEKIAGELFKWIDSSRDMFVYRRLALSGRGEAFDGAKARSLFSSHLDRIREMTGDPEWPARYLAVKVLLYDVDERSKRAVKEMFDDPHTLIRRTLIEEFRISEPTQEDAGEKEFYDRLLSFLTDDPAFEVRKTAKKRLMTDFTDRYEVDYSSLSSDQCLHLIEQYDENSAEDINSALEFLKDENTELRFAAGQFLDRAGTLESLFLEVDVEDREQLERNEELLRYAVEVHIDSFLGKISETDNPATLSIASNILCSSGDEDLIPRLAKKVFARSADTPFEKRLLSQTLLCIKERGTEEAVKALTEELYNRRYIAEEAELFLEHITGVHPFLVVPELKKLLEDPVFELRDKLHEALLRISPSHYIDELFTILKSEREAYPHTVRISALLLLGKLKLSYCMQFLLEQMPVLPPEEARDFSVHLKEYNGKVFQERVLDLLQKNDGKVKAALISAVPATGVKDFLKPIRDAVSDADPEVRRAAVWALLEYGDQRSIKSSLDLLRDPVERVRVEAARALGAKGKASTVENFSEILADENEVLSVKVAAIRGLAESNEPKSVDILVEQLKAAPDESEESAKEAGSDKAELQEEAIEALSRNREKKLVKQLIGHLKDAGPEMRESITEAFKRMGEESEGPLLELLREDIASLTPHITHVLEDTGYVEHTVRKLNHRDAEIRRDAAEILSRIGTTSAFRGIVLASRDPDEDVRVMVTRALERLGTESGNEILEELKNDPDKRIRKYTLWAMERVASKNSEEGEEKE